MQDTFTVGRFIAIGQGLEGLPEPGARYLVAHELGHIAWRHGAKTAAGLFLIGLGMMLEPVPDMALGVGAFGVTMLIVVRHYAEFQADAFAAGLLGWPGVLEGMQDVDRYLQRPVSPMRKVRIERARRANHGKPSR